jgi:antibiotic biosynthesis monooxygenase (ABM) superfamily enzyme
MSKSCPVHVAITRKIKPGMETQFENALRLFWSKTARTTLTLGAQMIRPVPENNDGVYCILRSFASQADHDAFYASPQFQSWLKYIQPFVEPDYSRRTLHGMEAFFSNGTLYNLEDRIHEPKKWKMAIVTWIGVWPAVYIAAKLIGPFHNGWPFWAGVGLETSAVVCALTWVIMPNLSKVFRKWLATA